MKTNTLLTQSDQKEFPSNWEIKELSAICEKPEYGYTESASTKEIGPKFLRITDIQNGVVNWDTVPFCKCSKDNFEKYQLHSGDILFARTGATTGKSYLITDCPDSVFASYLIRVRPKSEILPSFLYWYFNSSYYWQQIHQRKGGSTQSGVNGTILSKLLVVVPPVPEQEKITNTLSIIETSIQLTREIIRKTRILKTGMMHQYFVNGINHTNFKETDIGLIPKKWNVVKLGDKSISEIIMGQSPPSSSYNKNSQGLPFLQGNADFGETYPRPDTFTTNPIKISQENDILISVRAPVGEVNISPFQCCIGRGLGAIRVNLQKMNYMFMFYYMKYAATKLHSLSTGSTFKAIKKSDLDNFDIALPPVPEQEKIVKILSEVDKKLELENIRKNKLEQIKQGLMNDLLTGKKRLN